jgi:hypothetical protein
MLQSDDDDFLEVARVVGAVDFLRQDFDVAAVTTNKISWVEGLDSVEAVIVA